jgi:hypothetical protein
MLLAPCTLAAAVGLRLAVGAVDVGDPVELRWTGPETCPEAEFSAALARHVGARASAGAALPVQADVRREDGRWRLDLTVVGDAGTRSRRLTADSCEVVVDAAAFIVAQALVGASVPPPPEPAPAIEPAPPGPPAIATMPIEVIEAVLEDGGVAVVPSPGPRPRASLRGALRLRGGVSGVGLPGLQAAFGVVAGVVAARWRVELTTLGRLPARTAAGPGTARLAMWAVGARGCGVLRARRLEVPLCTGAEVGQTLGRSEGLLQNGGAAVVWAAVTASPGLAWAPRPWLALVLEAELAVALVRHDWVIRGLPPFERWLGPVDVRGSAGVELRLGRIKKP